MRLTLASANRHIRIAVFAIAVISMMFSGLASITAAALTDVSIELSDPRTSQSGVTYTVDMSGVTSSNARCVEVQFDIQADGLGGAPGGMTTTGGSLTSSTLIPTPASWTKDFATTNGIVTITEATGETLTNGDLVFGSFTNGNTESTTYYALIDTYDNVDCSTSPVDTSVVAWILTDGEPFSLEVLPTLTFTTAGVASGQDVFPNGGPAIVDTTVLSDASGIDHTTTVTSSANGLSAHDLNVVTNASSGYNVYIRHTGQLTNEGSDTIADWTGTNAVPTSFPAAGTEAWGYSTDDADLTQFYGLNLWAGFPTAGGSGGDQVMTNSGATSGTDTVRVGHQVGIATSTPAGTYTTTIIYTVVATF